MNVPANRGGRDDHASDSRCVPVREDHVDADALRESPGFDQWAVLGHSFGGQVALQYALRYPERVSQLLLCDTCGDVCWYEESAPMILRKRRDRRSRSSLLQRRFAAG